MPRPPHSLAGSPRRDRGLSLLEVMVAMSVLGICLVFLTQVLVQETFVERRTRAQVAAVRLLEAHAEIIRGGMLLPAEDGRYPVNLVVSPPPGAGLQSPRLWLQLKQLTPRGLWRIELELDYRVANRPHSKTLEMLVWRP